MIKLYISPKPSQFPNRGGVREHLVQFYKHARQHAEIELVHKPHKADIIQVQSVYECPNIRGIPIVYTCHGGFVPRPIQSVLNNLKRASKIVSVSEWIIKKFMPTHLHKKTIVIPNGIILNEFDIYGGDRDYVLYAKEYEYYFDDFISMAKILPEQNFVSTVGEERRGLPPNVKVIGLQSRNKIREVLNKACALALVGSEVCPTMLLEAWACGVPVIGVHQHGTAELMKNSGGEVIGGRLYKSNCLKQMKDASRIVITSSRSLGMEGYDHVKAYDWKLIFDRYVNVYKTLLGVKGKLNQ